MTQVGHPILTDREYEMFHDVQNTVGDDYSGKGYFSAKHEKAHPWGQRYMGQYPYISLGSYMFTQEVGPLLKNNMRVVDVGCGAGDKLLAFHRLNPTLHVTGLEYHPTMAAFARYVAPFAQVLECDALEHSYKHYDLIYMYRPFVESWDQYRLQDRVIRTMRMGAILVVFLAETTIFHAPKQHSNMFAKLDLGWMKTPKSFKRYCNPPRIYKRKAT